MAPKSTQEKPLSLNADQVKLICEVIIIAQVALHPEQWDKIASTMGISNGKAAKERFRYLMTTLSSQPTRNAKVGNKGPGTPKSATTTSKTPGKPSTTKAKTSKASTKRKKADEDTEADVTARYNDDAAEAVSPLAKKSKKAHVVMPKGKMAGDDVAVTSNEEIDDLDEGAEERRPRRSKLLGLVKEMYEEDAMVENSFVEEEFGVIGGGESSMFSRW